MKATASVDESNLRGHNRDNPTMEFLAIIYSAALLVSMLLSLELGLRYALAQGVDTSDTASAGKRIVEGGFFAFMSLLIAFSFSGAVSRFDSRRAMIVEEANNVGPAYLRIDLLSPDVQPQMRGLFRSYLDERTVIYQSIPDMDEVNAHLNRSQDLQKHIWALGLESTRGGNAHPNAGISLINAMNAMFDIANKRNWGALTHPPLIIYALLFVVALVCSFIAGNSLAATNARPWSHVLGFAILTCASSHVTLEIEYPRIGFVGIEKYDQALYDVRKTMK